MSAGGTVLMMQGGVPVVVPTSSLPVPLQVDALSSALASANAVIVGLTQRVTALEGKPDPCVTLSGALPVAMLQVGIADMSVAVPGLLPTDRIAVEVLADVPLGLTLGAIRPSPTAAGVLLVQAVASVAVAIRAAIPLAVTALR